MIRLGALTVALACTLATPAFAFELPGQGGGNPAALEAVHKQNVVLQQRTYAATIQILDAMALLNQAAGDAAEVQRIQALAKKLQAGKAEDPEALKAANAEVKATAAKLASAQFAPRELSEDEKIWAKSALTALGVAGLADAHVAKEAAGVAAEVAKVGMANPFAAMKVKDESTATKLVSDLVAEQTATMHVIKGAMMRFAQSHRVDAPTTEEIQAAYEAYSKR